MEVTAEDGVEENEAGMGCRCRCLNRKGVVGDQDLLNARLNTTRKTSYINVDVDPRVLPLSVCDLRLGCWYIV